MKKLFQICLIVVLMLVVIQSVAGGAVTSSNPTPSGTAGCSSSSTATVPEDAHALGCLATKGRIPQVGWNS